METEHNMTGYGWDEAFRFGNEQVDAVPPGAAVATTEISRDALTELAWSEEGENDELDWIAWGKLTDGRWFVLRAGCDYTGWDCQAGGSANVAASRDDIIRFGMSADERKRFGLEVPQ